MFSVLRSQSNRQSRHFSPAAPAAGVDADDKIEDSHVVAVVGDGKTNSLRAATAHRHTTENCLPKDESELQPTENHLQQHLIGCYFNS